MSSARRVDQGAALAAASALPATISAAQRSRYRTLRVMCRTSGLAATYTYIAAKADPGPAGGSTDQPQPDPTGSTELQAAYSATLEQVTAVLQTVGLPNSTAHPAEVVTWLGNLTTEDYTRASNAVAALLTWLSRLADASPDRQPHPDDGQGTAQ